LLDPEKLKYRMGLKFLDGVSLAEKCGITKSTVYNLLKARTQPRPETLQALCEALECEPADLLKEV